MRRISIGLCLLAAGCGVSTTDVDNFIAQMAAQQCAWEFRCCTTAEIDKLDGRKFTDEAGCNPYRTLALEADLFLYRLAAREGRLKVDTTRSRACISQLQAKACNPKPGMPAPMMDPMQEDACLAVFVGTTPVGQACIYTNECEKGARCVSDKAAVGRGVCIPWQQETQICNADADCDPKVKGLYCAKADFTCHRRAGEDGKCMYSIDGNLRPTLPMLLECDASFYCDPGSSECKRLPGANQPCLSPPPPGVTSSCDPDPTLKLVCDTGAAGGTAGTCRAPGQAGADCRTISCDTDLYCDTTVYQCKTLPGLGQSCYASPYQCRKPFYCNTSVSPYTCAEPASVGETCGGSVICYPDGYCDTTQSPSRCKPKLADGAICTSSVQCVSGSCGSNGGTGLECLERPVTVQCTGS
jgi:hypothetical protein